MTTRPRISNQRLDKYLESPQGTVLLVLEDHAGSDLILVDDEKNVPHLLKCKFVQKLSKKQAEDAWATTDPALLNTVRRGSTKGDPLLGDVNAAYFEVVTRML